MSAAFFRRQALWLGAAAALCASAPAARADHQPAIVTPTPRGLPPLLDGLDATGAVIEGDWGLYRPGAGRLMIYVPPGPVVVVPPPPPYFPMTGRPPRSGRQEVQPPPGRAKPPPAQSYYRSWSTESSGPVVSSPPPFDPPVVIEAQPFERRPYRKPRRRPR